VDILKYATQLRHPFKQLVPACISLGQNLRGKQLGFLIPEVGRARVTSLGGYRQPDISLCGVLRQPIPLVVGKA
jgi:hypothetical protein